MFLQNTKPSVFILRRQREIKGMDYCHSEGARKRMRALLPSSVIQRSACACESELVFTTFLLSPRHCPFEKAICTVAFPTQLHRRPPRQHTLRRTVAERQFLAVLPHQARS